jgi:hypothetical protein
MTNLSKSDSAFPLPSNINGHVRTLFREGRLECQHAPAFDHIETDARLVIVGITPGAVQQANANHALSAAIRAGMSMPEGLRHAKFAGSFSGLMRNNLVDMLNHVGAHTALGVETCAALFDPKLRGAVHFTSALRHPVFRDGKNYNGTPNMIRTPVLRLMIENYLAEEVQALPDALWLALGPKPLVALRHLVSIGKLDGRRLLPVLPHPSRENGERIKFFLDRKPREELSGKTVPAPMEKGRDELRAHFARQAASRGRA